jgi:putative Holliday junction resolvase
MRLMGLDLGERRIGVAISDPLGITAQGVSVYQRTGNLQTDLKFFAELIVEREINGVIIGLPKNMNGTEGPMAEKARSFGAELAKLTGISIRFWDERLSTGAAQKVLIEANMSRRKRRTKIDQVAAVIILQNYLDSQTRINFES